MAQHHEPASRSKKRAWLKSFLDERKNLPPLRKTVGSLSKKQQMIIANEFHSAYDVSLSNQVPIFQRIHGMLRRLNQLFVSVALMAATTLAMAGEAGRLVFAAGSVQVAGQPASTSQQAIA